MADFRLQVFYTVAKRSSFTKAAQELFITQPAVSRHIHELEAQYKTKLFERKMNKIELTAAGKVLLNHAEQIFEKYREAEFEINAINKRNEGQLRLGASTTIAQYIIPPLLAQFHIRFPEVSIHLKNGNTEDIENALLNKEIDLGFIEGYSRNPQLSYSEFAKDEIVLVCSRKHPMWSLSEVSLAELSDIPLVLRERGSGTLEVIEHALENKKLKLSDLNIEMQLGSTEAIKSYLRHSGCMALISLHAVIKELNSGELVTLDISDLSIGRPFYLSHLRGQVTGLSETFIRFLRIANNIML